MEDNQLVLAFKQLIKLIIDADKDLAKSINSETSAREDNIEDLISRITAEEQYRSNADRELSNADRELEEKIHNLVTSLSAEIAERQTGISNLDNKLNASVHNLETSDIELKNELDEESTTRSDEDAKLLDLINNHATALIKEVLERKESDNTLNTKIESETASRLSADSELTDAISNEAELRLSNDQSLDNKITAEASARESAITNVQNLITAEQTARTNEDAKLQQQINTNKTSIESETTTRISEDAKLQQQITDNKAAVDQLVVDNLTSSDKTKALSANQGRVLNNTFGNYYNKSEVDQLVVDTQSVFYGDGADSLTVPINADLLEGHPADYFISTDSILSQDTIVSKGGNYGEVATWVDGNQSREDRLYRFLTIAGNNKEVVVADSKSQIIGTSNIINNIGFLGNYTKGVETDISKVIVSILGTSYVKTRDKSIVANDYVVSDNSGSAIKSNNNIGYRVLRVVSDGLLEIAISPNTDTISRIKDDINTKVSELNSSINNEANARQTADNALTARMNTFTSLPEGSTTGDAELQDIRVAYDGTTYETAGAAVRGQVTALNTKIDNATSELKNDLGNLRFSITENNLLHIERKE